VGFHSQKFTTTEQNYPIYDHEFLAIMRGLHCWTHLLKGTHILSWYTQITPTYATTETLGKSACVSLVTYLSENSTISYWNTNLGQQTEQTPYLGDQIMKDQTQITTKCSYGQTNTSASNIPPWSGVTLETGSLVEKRHISTSST